MGLKSALKPAKLKIAITLIFGILWYLVLLQLTTFQCSTCPGPMPTGCVYDRFVIFGGVCNCGCFSLSYVLSNYFILLVPIALFYLLYSLLRSRNKK